MDMAVGNEKKTVVKGDVIVVPSVAIREGVLKNIDITRDHFLHLYNNVAFDYFVYDSKKVSQVRQFATSNQIQIMVINIDAFLKRLRTRMMKRRAMLSIGKTIAFLGASRSSLFRRRIQS